MDYDFLDCVPIWPSSLWLLACGFLACGFLACGFLACGFLACGFLACGFLACGFLACGFLAYDFLDCVRLKLVSCSSSCPVSRPFLTVVCVAFCFLAYFFLTYTILCKFYFNTFLHCWAWFLIFIQYSSTSCLEKKLRFDEIFRVSRFIVLFVELVFMWLRLA